MRSTINLKRNNLQNGKARANDAGKIQTGEPQKQRKNIIILATIYNVDKLRKLVNILSVSLFLVSAVVYFFTADRYLMVNKVVYRNGQISTTDKFNTLNIALMWCAYLSIFRSAVQSAIPLN